MTETERLRAVAQFYRNWAKASNLAIERAADRALADLFDGIAERHRQVGPFCGEEGCPCTIADPAYPCEDVRAALAVADALGISGE